MSKIRHIVNRDNTVAFVLLILISNFATKALKVGFHSETPIYPSAIVKGLITTYLGLFFLLEGYKSKLAKHTYIIGGIFLISVLVEIVTNGFNQDILYNRAYYFSKAVFFLLFIVYLDRVVPNYPKVMKLLFLIAKINLVCILIAFIFDVEVFRSYSKNRFGLNGIFPEPGFANYYYMLLMAICFYQVWFNKWRIIDVVVVLLGGMFIGTKATYLFIALLGYLALLKLLKKPKYQIGFSVFFLVLTPLIFNKVIRFIAGFFSFGQELLDKGVLTFITSTRDLLLYDAIDYIQEQWNVANFLIGGMDFKIHRVEFEFVDLFLFFGLLGVVFYLALLKASFFDKKNHWVFSALIISVLLISALSGNLFFSLSNSFFFILVFKLIQNQKTSIHQE